MGVFEGVDVREWSEIKPLCVCVCVQLENERVADLNMSNSVCACVCVCSIKGPTVCFLLEVTG